MGFLTRVISRLPAFLRSESEKSEESVKPDESVSPPKQSPVEPVLVQQAPVEPVPVQQSPPPADALPTQKEALVETQKKAPVETKKKVPPVPANRKKLRSHPGVDKKGFHVLSNKDNLYNMFDGRRADEKFSGKDNGPEEDFVHSHPGVDKKGVRVLSNKDNLYHMFNGRRFDEKFSGKDNEPEEDFARLFEESQADRYQQVLMNEKQKNTNRGMRATQRPVGRRTEQYPAPQAEVDLHGCNAVEAENRVNSFISNAAGKRLRTVRLIVGKGLHSEGKAVLPDVVENLLFQLKRSQTILGFKWEKKEKRKSGALIVYLFPSNR
ncbi:MAG: Smr/MutS family protein [bacterium]|nr:Smr/MutS family protein [bacterium]